MCCVLLCAVVRVVCMDGQRLSGGYGLSIIDARVVAAANAFGLSLGAAICWMVSAVVAGWRFAVDVELADKMDMPTLRILVES